MLLLLLSEYGASAKWVNVSTFMDSALRTYDIVDRMINGRCGSLNAWVKLFNGPSDTATVSEYSGHRSSTAITKGTSLKLRPQVMIAQAKRGH